MLLFLTGCLLPCIGSAAQEMAALFEALNKPGHFAIMRHALAPGTGDPADFNLKDRHTQRNLSRRGEDQARAIGDAFKKHDIDEGRIFTSQWFRCKETAELMDLGPVQELPLLNSFFQDFSKREPQTDALKTWIHEQSLDGLSPPLILVTHQVNITALTGVFPSSGEIVVLSLDSNNTERRVVGTIKADY